MTYNVFGGTLSLTQSIFFEVSDKSTWAEYIKVYTVAMIYNTTKKELLRQLILVWEESVHQRHISVVSISVNSVYNWRKVARTRCECSVHQQNVAYTQNAQITRCCQYRHLSTDCLNIRKSSFLCVLIAISRKICMVSNGDFGSVLYCLRLTLYVAARPFTTSRDMDVIWCNDSGL